MSLLPKNIKTKIGLSALSLTISYLLADKLIEVGVINTEKSVLILLIFIFIFTIANFLFVANSKEGKEKLIVEDDAKEKSSISQTDDFGEENEQNIELTTKTEKKIDQSMKFTKGSTQTIKIVPEK